MSRNEDTLINLCAHLEVDTKIEGRIKKILKENLDWDYFLKKAKRERVGSLVYKTLSRIEHAGNIVPKGIAACLEEVYYNVLGENVIRWKGLEKVLAGFNKEGIKTIIFKGPALAEAVYKDIGLRPMCDVDILVKEEDIQSADKMLKHLGYNPYSYIKDFSKLSANPYRNSIMYANKNIGLEFIHLFWHIINLYPYNTQVVGKIDMDKVWKDAEPKIVANARTLIFSNYHRIIHLSVHAFTHSFSDLILLCDINEILRLEREKIDWQVLLEEAASFGLSKYLYYGLYFCKEVFGSEVPDEVLQKLTPRKISVFEKKFIALVLERKTVSHSDIMASFGMNEGLFQRLMYLKGFLFPPKEFLFLIRQKETKWLSIFYYLKRIKAGISTTFRFFKDAVFK